MRLELHIEGTVIKGHQFDALHKHAINSGVAYEIFIIKESKIHLEPHPTDRVQKLKEPKRIIPRPKYKKTSDEDVAESIRLIDKGYDKKVVAKKYHVSTDYLSLAIKEFKHKTQLK